MLAENPLRIDRKFLSRYPEFVAFLRRSRAALQPNQTEQKEDVSQEVQVTPDESIEQAYAALQAVLADQVLERVKSLSPRSFEEKVVDLLVAMGYGGSHQDAARVVGQTGDGGIDGEIDEDKLGLDKIYVQAKRWDSSVGRPAVQAFAGSLIGRQASKGVFITTGTFTEDARSYVQNLPNMRLVLIDGQRLANLMIEHNVGVAVKSTFEIKGMVSDYFTEE